MKKFEDLTFSEVMTKSKDKIVFVVRTYGKKLNTVIKGDSTIEDFVFKNRRVTVESINGNVVGVYNGIFEAQRRYFNQ